MRSACRQRWCFYLTCHPAPVHRFCAECTSWNGGPLACRHDDVSSRLRPLTPWITPAAGAKGSAHPMRSSCWEASHHVSVRQPGRALAVATDTAAWTTGKGINKAASSAAALFPDSLQTENLVASPHPMGIAKTDRSQRGNTGLGDKARAADSGLQSRGHWVRALTPASQRGSRGWATSFA